MSLAEPDPPTESPRFQRKRAAILEAAATLINERGTKGLSLADVAEMVGLSTTSVTYYFRRKDQLAAACFEQTIDQLSAFVDMAAAEDGAEARIRRLVGLHVALLTRIQREEAPVFARLNDMRAMPDPYRAELIGRFNAIFRRIRQFFRDRPGRGRRALSTARTHVVLENMFNISAWMGNYGLDDVPRIERRLIEVLEHGIAPPGAAWRKEVRPAPDEDAEGGRSFLLAATRLINELGYRGASVERIASELNVTKGSFYHHLDAKNDLVLACFRRSLSIVSDAQKQAIGAGGSHLDQLATVVTRLLEVQFSPHGPLLRSTALEALPADLRAQVIGQQDRITRRFAGMLSDAISAGEIRTIDPVIAARAVMAMINAAFELRAWAAVMPLPRAIELYASTIFTGLFDD